MKPIIFYLIAFALSIISPLGFYLTGCMLANKISDENQPWLIAASVIIILGIATLICFAFIEYMKYKAAREKLEHENNLAERQQQHLIDLKREEQNMTANDLLVIFSKMPEYLRVEANKLIYAETFEKKWPDKNTVDEMKNLLKAIADQINLNSENNN